MTRKIITNLNYQNEDSHVTDLARSLRQLIADVFQLYAKTRYLHWCMDHMQNSGYALLLDDSGQQLCDLLRKTLTGLLDSGVGPFVDIYLSVCSRESTASR